MTPRPAITEQMMTEARQAFFEATPLHDTEEDRRITEEPIGTEARV